MQDIQENKIYKNAIQSIRLGIEDYKQGKKDSCRYISSIRNINAGVLLLFKSYLSNISPENSDEILIKKNIKITMCSKTKTLKFEGESKNTINWKETLKRYKDLNIKLDEKILSKVNTIAKHRNNIEHYYLDNPKENVKPSIYNCFIVIRYFINKVLGFKGMEHYLDKVTLKCFEEIEKEYEEEKKKCNKKIDEIKDIKEVYLEVIKEQYCENCTSPLIIPDGKKSFKCKSCDKRYSAELIIYSKKCWRCGSSIAEDYAIHPQHLHFHMDIENDLDLERAIEENMCGYCIHI